MNWRNLQAIIQYIYNSRPKRQSGPERYYLLPNHCNSRTHATETENTGTRTMTMTTRHSDQHATTRNPTCPVLTTTSITAGMTTPAATNMETFTWTMITLKNVFRDPDGLPHNSNSSWTPKETHHTVRTYIRKVNNNLKSGNHEPPRHNKLNLNRGEIEALKSLGRGHQTTKRHRLLPEDR